MVLYCAVELTMIGLDGRPNPLQKGYGLIKTHYREGLKTHRLERVALDSEIWKLADRFVYVIEDEFEQNPIDYTSLSFKAPCDLIMKNPREKRLYKVDDFPSEKISEFITRLHNEIEEL